MTGISEREPVALAEAKALEDARPRRIKEQ